MADRYDNPRFYPPVNVEIDSSHSYSIVPKGAIHAVDAPEIVVGITGADATSGLHDYGMYMDDYEPEPGEPHGGYRYSLYPTFWWRYRPLIGREIYVSTLGSDSWSFIDIFRRDGADPFDFAQLTHVWANESSQDSLNGESGGWWICEAGKDYYIRTGWDVWVDEPGQAGHQWQLTLLSAARTQPQPTPWVLVGGLAKAAGSGITLSNDGRTVIHNPLSEANWLWQKKTYKDDDSYHNSGRMWIEHYDTGAADLGYTDYAGVLCVSAHTVDGINIVNQLGGLRAGDVIAFHDGISYFDMGDWGPNYWTFNVTGTDTSGFLENGHLMIYGTQLNGSAQGWDYYFDGMPIRLSWSHSSQHQMPFYQYVRAVGQPSCNEGTIYGAFGFDINPTSTATLMNASRVVFTKFDMFGQETMEMNYHGVESNHLAYVKPGDLIRIGHAFWARATSALKQGGTQADGYNYWQMVYVNIVPVIVHPGFNFNRWQPYSVDVIPKELLPVAPTTGFQGSWNSGSGYSSGSIVLHNNIEWGTLTTAPAGIAPSATPPAADTTSCPIGANNVASAAKITIATDGENVASTLFSNSSFTAETGEPGYSWIGTPYRTCWWKYLPTTTGSVMIDTTGTTQDTFLTIYKQTDPTFTSFSSLTVVAVDINSAGYPLSRITMTFTAGVQYYIQFSANQNATFSYKININGARKTSWTTNPWTQISPRP